jgi:hypothetical protein
MNLVTHYITKNVAQVYGFIDDNPPYYLVATVVMSPTICCVHGFMSHKNRLRRNEIKQFCKYIGELCYPARVTFQVTPASHFRVYEPYLKVFSKEPSKTFNGFDAVTVEVMYKEEK